MPKRNKFRCCPGAAVAGIPTVQRLAAVPDNTDIRPVVAQVAAAVQTITVVLVRVVVLAAAVVQMGAVAQVTAVVLVPAVGLAPAVVLLIVVLARVVVLDTVAVLATAVLVAAVVLAEAVVLLISVVRITAVVLVPAVAVPAADTQAVPEVLDSFPVKAQLAPDRPAERDVTPTVQPLVSECPDIHREIDQSGTDPEIRKDIADLSFPERFVHFSLELPTATTPAVAVVSRSSPSPVARIVRDTAAVRPVPAEH